jgi:hypothetical protein
MYIALLIDCENARPSSIDGVLSELAQSGTISIRARVRELEEACGMGGQTACLRHSASSSPIRVRYVHTIDAMDLLYTERVDCFALVTSDSDLRRSLISCCPRSRWSAASAKTIPRTLRKSMLDVHPHRPLEGAVAASSDFSAFFFGEIVLR